MAADVGGYEGRLERAAIDTSRAATNDPCRDAYLVALRTINAFFENDVGPYRTGMTASDHCTTALWDPKVHGRRSLDDVEASVDLAIYASSLG